ncbi:MAG: DUF4082 domain-containing protein [Verrucomicrobiae bacterium]|nr:DUF4082 domain-containing protein [Verrucomicrobiae bacterium]
MSLASVLCLVANAQSPEPAGWYAGDMHVHRNCGTGSPLISETQIRDEMAIHNLAVVSLLADMGNGEVQDPNTDLPKVTGLDSPNSTANRILHWDAEWHWDPGYAAPHNALGGHIVALGLTNAVQIWEEDTYPIFQWARQQGGISGFAHMQHIGTSLPGVLNCCTPVEYPVAAALGASDFISEDCGGGNAPANAYYKLLNCGFRQGYAGGSDYPCCFELGATLTYVRVSGELTYRKWIEGIAAGRTVVSRNGRREFLDLKVNGTNMPGDEIQLNGSGSVSITVEWLATTNLSGTIELIHNGVVVASQAASVGPGSPQTLSTTVDFAKSGWLAARRMGGGTHQSHTAAVYVLVDGAPIRASASDANSYVQWIDELLVRTAPGGIWASYFITNREMAQVRYQEARNIFQQIALEAGGGGQNISSPSVTFTNPTPAFGDGFGVSVAALGTDRVLIGAMFDDTGATDAGSMYLYHTNGTLLTTISNPGPSTEDYFGWSVTTLGTDRILVGIPYEDGFGLDAGAAAMFDTNGNLLATLTNPSGGTNVWAGETIAVGGDDSLVILGANGDNTGGIDSGAVYLFTTNGTFIGSIFNPTPAISDYFGTSVAALGKDRILIGAYGDNAAGLNTGTAYIYHTNGTLLQTILNPTPVPHDRFGVSVCALGTERILVAGMRNDSGPANAAMVHMFTTNGTLVTTFTNPVPESKSLFGRPVTTVGGDRVLIGSHQAYGDSSPDPGRVFMFHTNGTLLATFASPAPANSGLFGFAVAAVGTNWVLIGDWGDNAGKAYMFALNPAAPPGAALTNIVVSPVDAILEAGDTQQMTATGYFSDGSTSNLTSQTIWESSNEAVATVSSGGLVTGVLSGSTVIGATLGEITGETELTITPPEGSVGAYRTAISGNWTDASAWQTNNGSAWVAASSSPSTAAVDEITIRNGHTITITASLAVDQVTVESGAQITVNSGQTFTIEDGPGTDLAVAGTVQNAGTLSFTSGATAAFQAGAVYQHSQNGGVIPTATWNVASTCLITGITSTAPTGADQNFGNFVWNCPSQGANNVSVSLSSIQGTLSIQASGTGQFQLSNGTTTAGGLSLSGGALRIASGTPRSLLINGDVSISAGTLVMSSGSATGNLSVTGDFSHTGGNITETSTGAGLINFTGTNPQTYTSGGAYTGTIHFAVSSDSVLMLGSNLLGNGSGGTFTLGSGGTLGIGHPQGITTSGDSGNVRVTGTRTYNTGSFIYNGSSAQVTGDGLPATLDDLIIANAAGLTLNGTHTINGVCTVNAGALLLGTGTINGVVTIQGSVAPGGSVGTLATGSQTWNGGGSYVWEINQATGGAGIGYDQLDAGNGQITVNATSENRFTLRLVTLNGSSPGQAADFDPNGSYTWVVARGGSVSGFDQNKFIIDASAFQNDPGAGYFTLEQSGSDIRLRFSSQLTVATTNLTSGVVQETYTAALEARGGAEPYAWSVIDGSLPPGLTLNSAGVLGGTPSEVGVFSFTAQVSDDSDPAQFATNQFSIVISLPPTILVLTNATNPFTTYYSEILLAEGLNFFASGDISTVSEAVLGKYDVVVLGEMALTQPQVTALSNWVNQGGNLIAMRPDKSLAGLLGLTDAATTLAEGYMLVDTGAGPGVGIVGETMQFHGTADRYTLAGASSVATLYSNASTPTANPAVTLRSVGPNGGQAAAFTYDLARSVVYTRQGNPAWEGQERDGIPPLRSSDLFFGNAAGDPQPDWVDPDKIAIPQADEQQRLLANLIIKMNAGRQLLPRFWYFPDGHKAAIVMTGDDHGYNGTAAHFERFLDLSGTNTSVADWRTVRSSSYLFPNTPLSDAAASAYHAAGFEIGLHCNSGCGNYTTEDIDGFFETQLQQFAANYPSLPPPTTHRMHCIAWSGYTILPEVGLLHGIRLDTTYYYWPASWVANRIGLFTGSGMAMRFATTNGNLIDVYQAATQMTDESGLSYPHTAEVLMDRALGPEGYYGAFVANMHTDPDTAVPGRDSLVWATEIVLSAIARGVPVITAHQLLTWLDARNASSISVISSSNGTQLFSVAANPNARGLQVMAPLPDGFDVTALQHNGNPVTYSLAQIKGIRYAVFPGVSGYYEMNYAPDVTPPAVTSVTPAENQLEVGLNAGVTVVFSESLALASINHDTIQLRDAANALVPASLAYVPSTFAVVLSPSNIFNLGETYTLTVKGGVGGVSDSSGNLLANDFTASFTTVVQPPDRIWTDAAAPVVISDEDTNPVELGLKFRSSVAGQVLGVRFYKGPENLGIHTGNLWTDSGTLLASVTFTNETAAGWQAQAFSTPVAINSNTTYVVSYHAPSGRYSKTEGYFATSGVTNYPLRALKNGEDGPNGVFGYGPSGFPTNGYLATHYWVDVVFAADLGPDNKPPTITTVHPAANATEVDITTAVTLVFDEPMAVASIGPSTITLSNTATAQLVPASVSYNPATFVATLRPDAALALSTLYSIRALGGAGGVTDLAGNPLATSLSSSFATAAFISGTVGNTNDGTIPDPIGTWINTDRFLCASNLTATSVNAKIAAVTGRYKCAIYSDSNGVPARLLGSTIEVTNPVTGWHNFPLPASVALTNGQFYWLAVWSDSANAQTFTSGTSGTIRWADATFGPWPDPINTGGTGNLRYCIYASGYVTPNLTSIAVTPANPTIPNGDSLQFTAMGTLSGGGQQDVTSLATWTSSNLVVATVNGNGLATGVSDGTATISASLGGISGSTLLTVATTMTDTTTSVATSGSPSTYGSSVIFTATVTPNTAAGTVDFFDGVNLLGSAPLTGTTTKTAAYTTTATQLAAGTRSITATYAGSGSHASSTSSVLNQTVNTLPVQLSGTRVYDGTTSAAANVLTIDNNLDAENLTLSGAGVLSAKDVGERAVTAAEVPVRVNSATGNSGSSTVNSFGVTVPAAANGNTLIAVIATRGTSANRVSSITQTGATWTRASQTNNTSGSTTEIWYAPNVSSAGTTVTINLATSLRAAAVVMEYSGILIAAPLDQTAGSTNNTGTTALTGTTPPTTQSNELWIGGIGVTNSARTLSSIQNSFTQVASAQSTSGTASQNSKVFALERIVSATEAASSGGTLDIASIRSGTIATFKAALPSGTPLVLGGSAAGNYTLTGMNGAVNVTQQELTVTGLTGVNKPYDGNTAATASGTASLNGVISPDVVTLNGTPVHTFAQVSVGADIAIMTTGYVLGGADADNYSLTPPSLSADITPAPLTVTANHDNKIYDGLPYTGGNGVTYDGFVNGEGAEVLAGTLSYGGSAQGAIGTGIYSIIPSGLSAANYSLGFENGSLVVAPATLSVVADNAIRAFGQANPLFTGQLTGVQPGDDITAIYSSPATPASPVGTYAINPALQDPDSKLPNYDVSITPGVLTIVGQPVLVDITESSPGMFTLQWLGHPGRTYRLQFKHGLADAEWDDLSPDAPASESGMVSVVHDAGGIGANVQGFYRLLDVTP